MPKTCSQCRIAVADTEATCIKCGGPLAAWEGGKGRERPPEAFDGQWDPALVLVELLGMAAGVLIGWMIDGVRGACIGGVVGGMASLVILGGGS